MTQKRFFFCFGPAKSGTTFLQRTLNLHPNISCPSEHNFDVLVTLLKEAQRKYNHTLQIVDRRTGGQGATLVSDQTLENITKLSICQIMIGANPQAAVCGVNDNSILKNVRFYRDHFPQAQFIVIFRHPLTQAVSAWKHNHRLAEEENNPQHVHHMLKHGDFDDWVRLVAKNFNNAVVNFSEVFRQDRRALIVRYEDLVNQRQAELLRLFAFLNVEVSPEQMNHVIENSQISAMRTQSNHPGFFRAGETNPSKSEIHDQLRQEVNQIAKQGLEILRYPTS